MSFDVLATTHPPNLGCPKKDVGGTPHLRQTGVYSWWIRIGSSFRPRNTQGQSQTVAQMKSGQSGNNRREIFRRLILQVSGKNRRTALNWRRLPTGSPNPEELQGKRRDVLKI
ncbi:uncharacterized protein LOC108136705 [Drosophila elegans]|uniref:uncharacterized protein LOC108136705 n=1 Tax=Drosophila elegans TaxID=30023 RepID=UPI001BC839D4|nr:uncharacterized protein LOC108136705 [Drosophila elegans]